MTNSAQHSNSSHITGHRARLSFSVNKHRYPALISLSEITEAGAELVVWLLGPQTHDWGGGSAPQLNLHLEILIMIMMFLLTT